MGEVLPKPGSILDGYTIIRELGRGGMGAVFLAEKDTATYALKVLLDLEPEQLLRFEREARAMAAVDRHPNIVTIHTLGRYQGLPYVVMSCVDGGDLRGLLKARGQLELDEAMELMATVADAVGYIHEQGIIHRDLKPENILIRAADSQPIVTDFGLARGGELANLTHTGFAGGTPHYMAPEQISGSWTVGPRADVWALGVIFYELIAGRRPFEGATLVSVGAAILESEPEAVAAPAPVIAVLERALSKTPRARYADGQAFKAALLAARTRSRPRARILIVAAALLIISGLILGGLGLRAYTRARELRRTREALSLSLQDFDAQVLRYAEDLINARLQERLPELPPLAEETASGAALASTYARFEAELHSREALDGLAEITNRRAMALRALFDDALGGVPDRLQKELAIGPLLAPVRQLRKGEDLKAGGLKPMSGEVARLLELCAILAAAERGDWYAAYLGALKYEREHRGQALGSALAQAAQKRNDLTTPAFWERVYKQATAEEGPPDQELEVSALAGFARHDFEKLAEALKKSLARRPLAQERIVFLRQFHRAILPPGERALSPRTKRLLRELIGFFGSRESVEPEAFREHREAYLEAHDSYIDTNTRGSVEIARALGWSLQLKRMAPELPVRFPMLDNGNFLPNKGRFLTFQGIRDAIFVVARSSAGYRIADLPFLTRAIALSFRYGSYLEIPSAFAERLRQDQAIPQDVPEICADFLFSHIELQLMRRLEGESLERYRTRQRALLPELLERLERVIYGWEYGPRPEIFIAVARYKRGRLLRFAIEQGWERPERRASMVKDYLAAAASPELPFAPHALIDLASYEPAAVLEQGFGYFDERIELLKQRQLLARSHAELLADPSDLKYSPWPEILPIVGSRNTETYLLMRRGDLACRAGKGAECLRYFDAFDRRWAERTEATCAALSAVSQERIAALDPADSLGRKRLRTLVKNVQFGLRESLAEQRCSLAVARGRVLNRLRRHQEALAVIRPYSIEEEGLLAEVRIEALARLGKRKEALDAIEEIKDPNLRAALIHSVETIWTQ